MLYCKKLKYGFNAAMTTDIEKIGYVKMFMERLHLGDYH
jgi:hypothetical protein